ncbi:MAG: hypothetical protein ACTHK8_14830 [Ginsengibacter sp.]
MHKTFRVKSLPTICGIFMGISTFLFSCEPHGFDKDKRQIMAKDEIRSQLHKVREYDITGFKEDTVEVTDNPDFKKEIRYHLDFSYIDSNNVLQQKSGDVFFTPDGSSIINSKISDK